MNRGLVAMLILWLSWVSPGFAAAPVNDHLVNAIAIPGAQAAVRGTNVDATKEVGEPDHASHPGGKSVWWTWTAPADGSVVIETTGSSFDTLLAAYTGSSFTGMRRVAENDDKGGSKNSLIYFNVVAGMIYRVAVDGYAAAAGEIELAVTYRNTPLERPSNDDFAARITLAGAFVQTAGANFFAGKEPDEPNHADELGGASAWWSWAAPATGSVTIHTEGSTFDTLLAVYTGSTLTNLVVVAQSDDISTNQAASSVTFHAEAGLVYQVAVDGFNGDPGDLQLTIGMNNLLTLGLPERVPFGGYRFALTSSPGGTYAIEATIDLSIWTRLATLTNPTGLLEFTDSTAPGLARRFYRARRVD